MIQPVEHYAQEAIQIPISTGVSVAHIVIGVAVGVAVGVGSYLLWRYTHQWTRPGWADIQAGENVEHTRFFPDKPGRPGGFGTNVGHVLKDHVYIDDSECKTEPLETRKLILQQSSITRIWRSGR